MLKNTNVSVIINLLLEWVIVERGDTMFLNVWNSIRDFIVNLFSNIRWGNIFIFFMGIIVGFVICGMIYLIIFFKSIKKDCYFSESVL